MSEISTSDDISKIVTNFQTQSLKREIELLDEKLRLLDQESQNKISNLSNQLAQEKESEIKLRNQLSKKDKAISELNEIIKEYQNELITQKKNLSFKEEKLQEMMTQFNSIKSNCNTISAALNSKEENQKKNELELRKAINDKMKIESKIKELIGVVNEYMKQLDELNEKCSNLERENNNLKLINSNLVNENKKLFNENNDYSIEIKNIKETIDKCEEMSNKYVDKNKNLNSENENLKNQLIENKQRIDSLLSENNKLNMMIKEFKIKKSKIENELAMTIQYQKKINDKHENELKEIVSYCNDNINKIIKWIENSFGVTSYLNNDNNSQNQISLDSSFSNSQYANINFEELKKKLNIAQENLNKDKILIQKYKEESNEKYNLFMLEKGKYLDILKKIYNKIISEIHSHNYFICDYNINSFNNPKNDEFLKLLNLNEAVINQVLKYLSSIFEEKNLILKEIEKYKNNINDLQMINDNLIQENNDYKVKVYNNDYSKLQENMNDLQENYDKCLQMNQMLEKKIKNYETEFELKQMQINSLEEMVKRRNSNSNAICNNTENNNSEGYQPGYYNNSYNSTSFNNQNKTIQRLEQDREKLIKDNMKLIQYNKKLKEQINNLNKIINSITMNNNNEKENNDNIDLNDNENLE